MGIFLGSCASKSKGCRLLTTTLTGRREVRFSVTYFGEQFVLLPGQEQRLFQVLVVMFLSLLVNNAPWKTTHQQVFLLPKVV